jgi:hypothetical protein
MMSSNGKTTVGRVNFERPQSLNKAVGDIKQGELLTTVGKQQKPVSCELGGVKSTIIQYQSEGWFFYSSVPQIGGEIILIFTK